jgi:hypothetical protein
MFGRNKNRVVSSKGKVLKQAPRPTAASKKIEATKDLLPDGDPSEATVEGSSSASIRTLDAILFDMKKRTFTFESEQPPCSGRVVDRESPPYPDVVRRLSPTPSYSSVSTRGSASGNVETDRSTLQGGNLYRGSSVSSRSSGFDTPEDAETGSVETASLSSYIRALHAFRFKRNGDKQIHRTASRRIGKQDPEISGGRVRGRGDGSCSDLSSAGSWVEESCGEDQPALVADYYHYA